MALEISHPILQPNILSQKLCHENIMAYGGEYTLDQLEFIEQIVKNTSDIMESECRERGKSGFMLAISLNNKATIVIQIGQVDESRKGYEPDGAKLKFADYADAKVEFLKNNSTRSRSSQSINELQTTTTLLKENVVGGAVAFNNGVKIGISGLSSVAIDDENAVLKIGKAHEFEEAISGNF